MSSNDPSPSAPKSKDSCHGVVPFFSGSPEPDLPPGPPPSPQKRTGLRKPRTPNTEGGLPQSALDRIQEQLTKAAEVIRESVSASPDSSEEDLCLEELDDLGYTVTIAKRKIDLAQTAAKLPGVKDVQMITLSTTRQCHMKRLGVLEFELVTMKRFETKVIRAIARSGSFKNTFGTALEEFEKYEPRVLILERELFELEDSIIGKKEEAARMHIDRVLISALVILKKKPLEPLSVMLGLAPEVRVSSYQLPDQPELIRFRGHATYISGELDFVCVRLKPKLNQEADAEDDAELETMKEHLRGLESIAQVDPIIANAGAHLSMTVIEAKRAGHKQELRAFLPQAIAESLVMWRRLKTINKGKRIIPHTGVPFILTNGSEWIFGILIKGANDSWKASCSQNLKVHMENMQVAGKRAQNIKELNAVLKAIMCWILASPTQIQAAMNS